MTWVAVGIASVGTLKGTLDARQAKKDKEAHNRYRQAAIAYSPWTGMSDPGMGNFGTTDMLSGGLGGGLQGFALGSQIGAMGGGAKKSPTPTPKKNVPGGTDLTTMNYLPQSPWGYQNPQRIG